MSAPIRIKLSRRPGFRLQAESLALNGLAAVKVDRTTRFGNPYMIGHMPDPKIVRRWGWTISPHGRQHFCKSSTEAVARFRYALLWDAAIHEWLREQLGGKNLACWCELHGPCHADPLLFIANSTPDQINAMHEAVDLQIMREAAALTTGKREE